MAERAINKKKRITIKEPNSIAPLLSQDWKNIAIAFAFEFIVSLLVYVGIVTLFGRYSWESLLYGRIYMSIICFIIYFAYYIIGINICMRCRRVDIIRKKMFVLRNVAFFLTALSVITGTIYWILESLSIFNGMWLEVIFSSVTIIVHLIIYYTRLISPVLVI